MTPSDVPRRGTCLALRFQTGSWMLFIDSCLSATLFPGCDRRPRQLTVLLVLLQSPTPDLPGKPGRFHLCHVTFMPVVLKPVYNFLGQVIGNAPEGKYNRA